MYIITDKKNRKTGDKMIIFEFESPQDKKDFFDGMRRFINHAYIKDFSEFNHIIDTLESRCDNKYANERCYESAMLFSNEADIIFTHLVGTCALTLGDRLGIDRNA